MANQLKEMKMLKPFCISFTITILTLFLSTELLAQESDNCSMQGEFHICEFSEGNYPACHNTEDFPSPVSVAEFYNGKVIRAGLVALPDGRAEVTTLIEVSREDRDIRYLFKGIREITMEPFDNCMVGIATRMHGDPT